MENASKALLIAAAVLIVILLIAFGVSILGSTNDVSSDAKDTGAALTNQVDAGKDSAITALQGISGWGGTTEE